MRGRFGVRAFDLQKTANRAANEFWRCINISSKELSVNENIKFKEVRTIGSDGSQLGIMPVAKALEAAYGADLDLVCISPNAEPPVCKIMDYGKYRFEGDKVKVSIRFRGRELGHPEIGLDTMKRFAEYCADHCTVEKAAKMEGRNMIMFLAPKSGK